VNDHRNSADPAHRAEGTSPGSGLAVRDNRETSRFELQVDGQVAFLEYRRSPHAIILKHTEVPESLRGRGLGAILAKAALEMARDEGLRVNVQCPFVKAFLEKHPELAQQLKP
jgi:hypothetical protein